MNNDKGSGVELSFPRFRFMLLSLRVAMEPRLGFCTCFHSSRGAARGTPLAIGG